MLFPKSSRATLFPSDSICSSPFLLCFLALLSFMWITWQGCRLLLLFLVGLVGAILLPFLYFNSGFVSKKTMMKWKVAFLLFLFGCNKQIVLLTSSSTDILLSVLLLFSWINCASLSINTSFFLALIFSLLHLWWCTHFLFPIGFIVSLVCFHHFFFDLTTTENLIAGTLNN